MTEGVVTSDSNRTEKWQTRTIRDVALRVGSGITPTGGVRVYKSSGRPFVRSQNVGWGNLDMSDIAFIDEQTHRLFPSTELVEGDLLLNITGASIGRVAVADQRLTGGNVNQHVCIIRPDRRVVVPSFLASVLLSQIGQNQIDSFQAGGNRQGLNFGQVRSIAFALPSVEEQRAIAEALGDVDELIRSLERLIAKKRDIKQAVMQQLLTGKTRLPGFTGEWQTVSLGSVSEMNSGGTPATSNEAYYGGDIPFVSISDMTGTKKILTKTERTLTAAGFASSAARMFQPGTVLYAMYASLGECAIAGISLCTSQAILGIRPHSSMRSEFLYYYLTSLKSRVKSLGQQGTQSNLNKKMVQDFELALPPLKEQQAISEVLGSMDEELGALEQRLWKTRDIKQGMMQQLLTGKVRLV